MTPNTSPYPKVSLMVAMSLDGKIATATKESARFTSDHDKHWMDTLRARVDAIILGAQTLRALDPPLQIHSETLKSQRMAAQLSPYLSTVLLSKTLEFKNASRFLQDTLAPKKIIATTNNADADWLLPLSNNTQIWRLGKDQVDLPALLIKLKQQGMQHVLLEGGGITNWGFVSQNLVDDYYITIAPTLLGGQHAPTWLEGMGFALQQRQQLQLIDIQRHEHEIYCHYQRML